MNQSVLAPPVRMALVLENRVIRESLARLVRKNKDLVVTASCSKADGTREQLLAADSDVLVLDFLEESWFPSNWIAIQPPPLPKCLLIAMTASPQDFLSAIRGGISGYLSRNASALEVLDAVRAVHNGASICPKELVACLFREIRTPRQTSQPPLPDRSNLTIRQRHLISLVARGLTNKEIASELHLSEYTVRNHLSRIMKQVDAVSRSAAVDAILGDRASELAPESYS